MQQKNHFTMEELEYLVLVKGQGDSVVTAQHSTGVSTYHPPPVRRDIRRAIYNVVYEAKRAVSRLEIARLLGLKKTPWLLAAIEELVAANYLVKHLTSLSNGMPMYFYEVVK